ncbi:hypothetical protein RRG08_053409 [Elysia crispata]|uniref:Uncharacterized protein n=1 Tax=Elysia crispata TaxID=231223 RepID=A0AAE0ZHE2_9GAST|nr:hypothetical protein RRG08_053409 [Elysia crispata]
MAKVLLAVVVLALAAEISYQQIFHPFGAPGRVLDILIGNPNRQRTPFIPASLTSYLPGILNSKRSDDNRVDIDVNTGPKGTSGTISGSHTTKGGTTIKGYVTHGPGGTSGGGVSPLRDLSLGRQITLETKQKCHSESVSSVCVLSSVTNSSLQYEGAHPKPLVTVFSNSSLSQLGQSPPLRNGGKTLLTAHHVTSVAEDSCGVRHVSTSTSGFLNFGGL